MRWIFGFFMVSFGFLALGQYTTLDWKITHPLSKKQFPLGTHGSVQEALIAAGELPDPFVGTNEKDFAWVENYTWEFNSELQLEPVDLKKEHIDLEFPNVDTYAKVYFNDHLLGTTENCYITYRFDVRPWAKPGANKVKLVFQSPVSYQSPKIKNIGFTLPAPNDVGKVAVAPWCRKPQYQFGWDWSLRMTTMGFWKPVTVHVYSGNRSVGQGIYTATLAEDFALMELQWLLRLPEKDTLLWESELFGSAEVVMENGILKRLERLDQPQLWWPRGQGAQHLYTDTWRLIRPQNGEVITQCVKRFGVRRTELITAPDRWGTSYTIRVNGRDVFCKGANYIPQDIFPARVTDAALRETVDLMKLSNFNMVRVWGGGYYQPEAFYEACDEAGIMVWQDFMFACAMYPGTDTFVENVRKELDEQIPRLASHASLVLFNGNNEVDVAWKNWGFQKTYNITESQSEKIAGYYDRIFKQLIPETLKKWTNVPYIHTSPLSNWGKDEYFNHGSMHYWGVWHGKDPLEDFGRKTGRFNAEYGFQSFPEYSTLLQFSDTAHWDLNHAIMKHHQKSYVGNGMIAKHANELFGKTTDFKRFVYYSQLTQSVAVSMAVSSHRVNMPRCSGTIYWQLNDCWPAPTWSSIDYYGNWKALQYTVKEDYRDVAVLAKIDTIGKEQYYLVSDQPHAIACKIRCVLYDLKGKVIDQFSCNQAVMGTHVNKLFDKELEPYSGVNYLAVFTWNDQNGDPQERTFTHLPQTREIAPENAVDYRITDVDLQHKTATLEVYTTEFLSKCWISANNKPIWLEENFLDLLPGIHRIRFHFDELPDKKNLFLIWL